MYRRKKLQPYRFHQLRVLTSAMPNQTRTFGTHFVTLQNLEFVTIPARLAPGSYIVTISPLQGNYPTATFTISQATPRFAGLTLSLTATHGGSEMELTWPSGGSLEVRKTTDKYNGRYVVDIVARFAPAEHARI